MITSTDNQKLRTIRKLQARSHREATGLFVAEGEDLIAAAEAAGASPEIKLEAGRDIEPSLLDQASGLGSGSRVVAVYRQRWVRPAGELSVYLDGVQDPGNVGAVIRAAHALCDGTVTLGPNCADPYSPKAVRASMGSVFARPPARAQFADLAADAVALTPTAELELARVQPRPPVVVCVGSERTGLSEEVTGQAAVCARIPQRHDGPTSLNAAMAATIALYELTRIDGRV